jgi:cytochrome c nitrite reductase small subunit
VRALGVAIAVLVGLAVGVGGYTFVYAKGASYLTNAPEACANCHVMREPYDAWVKSSHRAVAVCNDCHTPHGWLARYATKAANGFWHSFAFTTGRFPEPLRIKPHNRAITEEACRRCHAEIVEAIDRRGPADAGRAASGAEAALRCVGCHQSVGHAA